MRQSHPCPTPYYNLNPSPVARRLLWHLLAVGGGVPGPRTYTASDKPGVVVLWIHSGRGSLTLGSLSVALRPGPRCWLFNVRQPRTFLSTEGEPIVTESIRFSGPGVEAWLEELDVARAPEFRLNRLDSIRDAQRRLLALAKSQPANWEWQAHDILHAMLREFLVARKVLQRPHQGVPRDIQRALNAIEADPFRDWGITELAHHAGLAASTFRARFREAMDESPHQYLQRCRLDLARELLTDRNLRIKEIAKRLQFSNEDYFARFFRKLTGLSPTEFRSQLESTARGPVTSRSVSPLRPPVARS